MRTELIARIAASVSAYAVSSTRFALGTVGMAFSRNSIPVIRHPLIHQQQRDGIAAQLQPLQ